MRSCSGGSRASSSLWFAPPRPFVRGYCERVLVGESVQVATDRVEARRVEFLGAMTANKRERAVLAALFGAEWSERFLTEVLFAPPVAWVCAG